MTTRHDSVAFDRKLEIAPERLRALISAIGGPQCAEPRSLLLVGSGAADSHLESMRAGSSPHTLLEVRCRDSDLNSFAGTRQLLRGLAPIVAREAPQLLERFGPEVAALDAELATRLGIQPRLSLAQLALTPSERRAHRESEQAFRLINGFCQLVVEATRACPTLVRAPLVVWWTDLQAADRPSLLTFRRLDQWLNQAQAPMLLVGTFDPDAGPAVYEPAVPAEVERWLNWRAPHGQLLSAVRGQLMAEQVPLAPLPRGSMRVRGPADAYESVEVACAHAIRQMRQAVFDLNYEHVLLLARRIIASLAPLDEQNFDGARFETAWRELTASDTYAALEFSVAGMRRKRDVLLTVWKATALVHTFLDHHQLALECYQHALGLADTPAMRAQLYMYLGLIAGKRLHRSEQAHDYLARGFQAIAGAADADAALERGWLLNVSALMAYQAGQHADAMRMVQEALTHLRPFHHSEATHLKINVVSNISVLLEDSGRLEQSLATWGIFRSFLGAATEIFAKHYQYREGGLRLKAGHSNDALVAFRASHDQAAAIGDSFHMEVAARACGYTSHALGDLAEAGRWYAASAAVCQQIGNYAQLPKSILAQALCAYELGDGWLARTLVERAETLAQRLELPLPAARLAQHALQTGASDALADWSSAVLESPGSKLNRPFSLTNLAPVPAA